MADDGREYQIILERVPEDRQPETALFLSGCFSLPPASTKGIAASGPIAIISDLEKGQAEAILADLPPSLPPDVVLRLADGSEATRVSRLQWPRPPRIYGRDLDDFLVREESGDIKCPLCGGLIRVSQESGVLKAVPAGGEKRKSDTLIRPAPFPSDNDPLFSGIKPLATGTANYASIRSLQAGDTGFWMDHGHNLFAPPPPPADSEESVRKKSGETSNAKRSSGKITAGLAAFMKPGAFSLVVGRTKDPAAVKMIAEILGISESEAREKCLSLGLCVARDISLDEAQNLLARFRSLNAKARIVKPM
ncbi:MAG: hypothetical protein LIQ30_00295 [Planctomycetes bacterium]|nr:hypothetical protein [Planctomycetota bacterium]